MNCLYTAASFFILIFLLSDRGPELLHNRFSLRPLHALGFFKYNWIVANGAQCGFILFGLLWFVPSLESAVTAARALPMEFPLAPESIGTNIWHLVQNLGTALLFAGVLALSVFKPWGKLLGRRSPTSACNRRRVKDDRQGMNTTPVVRGF